MDGKQRVKSFCVDPPSPNMSHALCSSDWNRHSFRHSRLNWDSRIQEDDETHSHQRLMCLQLPTDSGAVNYNLLFQYVPVLHALLVNSRQILSQRSSQWLSHLPAGTSTLVAVSWVPHKHRPPASPISVLTGCERTADAFIVKRHAAFSTQLHQSLL